MTRGRKMSSPAAAAAVTTARAILFAAAFLMVAAIPARAQSGRGRGVGPQPPSAQQAEPQVPVPQDERPISAGQIQRWFEAYTVLQAQEALGLTEAQYGRFVTRLKSLQEIRRRHQQARNKILNQLRQLTTADGRAVATPDESAIAEQLRLLRDEDDRGAADLRKAYEGVDETLTVTQQGRYRTFEERMEQQKLELLLRARQNARANRARGK
jgi:hypothetical protein